MGQAPVQKRVGWSPDEITHLRKLHGEDVKYEAIAAEMTQKFDRYFSRQAICGKVYSLGLSDPKKRATKARQRAHDWNRPRGVATFPPLAVVKVAEVTEVARPLPATAVDLNDRQPDQCCWPVTDGVPWLFCGAEKAPGDPSYCPEHRRRMGGGRKVQSIFSLAGRAAA